MRWLHRTILWGSCALGLLAPGCNCSGGTLGAPCDSDTDCNAGEFCSPMGFCEVIPDTDAGDIDAGDTDAGDIDAGDTGDGGVDADTCVDMDMDGVTNCAGDCDDSDPLTFPGAVEVCGDGIDNACGTMPDNGCGGIGTFVSATVGDDTNPGTQASPVQTIRQGMMNALTIGGGVDVFVADGDYPEDITMIEGITLWGGYEASGWTRDPAANPTNIDNQTANGVTFPAGITRATAIDGFVVRGRSGVSSSSAITLMNGSEPSISNNDVRAGNAGGNSAAIRINPANMPSSANPLIEGNIIRLGGAGGGWGGGNGSWGIRAQRSAAEIVNNEVLLAEHFTVQRGMELVDAPDTMLVQGNTVRHPAGRAEVVFGIRVASGGGTYDNNDISAGRCETFCLGLALEGNLTTVVVTNNIIVGGEGGTVRSSALSIGFERVPTTSPDILVHSNTLDGGPGTRTGSTYGLHLGERPSAPIVVGRFFNNVMRSGNGGAGRFAAFEEHPNIDPDIFENNALFLAGGSSAIGNRALYHDEGTTNHLTAAAVNGMPQAANNIADDCSIVDPRLDGDWHLGAGSMCIDAGTATEAPSVDFEGDSRPNGSAHDIGADES